MNFLLGPGYLTILSKLSSWLTWALQLIHCKRKVRDLKKILYLFLLTYAPTYHPEGWDRGYRFPLIGYISFNINYLLYKMDCFLYYIGKFSEYIADLIQVWYPTSTSGVGKERGFQFDVILSHSVLLHFLHFYIHCPHKYLYFK